MATTPRGTRGNAAERSEYKCGSLVAMDGNDNINGLTNAIIAGAIRVHARLGPGLLEHAYLKCLSYELERKGLRVATELPLALRYENLRVEGAYRVDLLVEDTVIVEVKAVEKVLPVHCSQLLTYLKLSQGTSVCCSIST